MPHCSLGVFVELIPYILDITPCSRTVAGIAGEGPALAVAPAQDKVIEGVNRCPGEQVGLKLCRSVFAAESDSQMMFVAIGMPGIIASYSNSAVDLLALNLIEADKFN